MYGVASPSSHPPLARLAALLSAIAIGGLLPAVGCGRAEATRLAVFPVKGQVTLNGKPLSNALVVLHPKTPAPGQSTTPRATTDANGDFQVSTYDTNDGAPTGEYAVTIQHFPLLQKGESFEPGPNSLPKKLSKPDTTDLPPVKVASEPLTIPTFALKR